MKGYEDLVPAKQAQPTQSSGYGDLVPSNKPPAADKAAFGVYPKPGMEP